MPIFNVRINLYVCYDYIGVFSFHCHRDQVNKTNLYKSGPGLSRDIIETINPIYHDLTKDTVLMFA